MSVVHSTTSSFDSDVLAASNDAPVLVDFWAPWCGPCRMVSPILDKLAADADFRVKIVKVNVDDEPDLAGRYGISSIPTMLLIRGEQIVETVIGARNEPSLRALVAPYV